MNRNQPLAPERGSAIFVGLVVAALSAALAGCNSPQFRTQSGEENELERYDVRTVGEITEVGNADPIPVSGVGLVVGLNGSGGDCPKSGYRTMLENQLKKQNVGNTKEVLAHPDHALVLVSGFLPAGARKDDPIDLEITLPPGSRAVSLRGGYLRECSLYNYESIRNLTGGASESTRALLGHPLAKGEGPVMVGFGDGDAAAKLKRGRVWAGGHCRLERPFHLMLTGDYQYARLAALTADRVNDALQGHTTVGTPGSELAVAKDNTTIFLNMPPQYKLNIPRFLRVVRLIPIREGREAITAAGGSSTEKRAAYRKKLADDLLDPARTVVASLRLEALGKDSTTALKSALESNHPLVRFCAAEALAYLGNTCCGEELAQVVEKQPLLRAYALTALASLDEAVCHVKLKELLCNSTDDEVRYGTFRALRTLDERDSAVRGDLLNDTYWLHVVAPEMPPLVHISTTKRPEIVLFGERVEFKPPFSFLAGNFAVTAGADNNACLISYVPTEGGEPIRQRCSLRVEHVIKCLAYLGATYPEVLDVLRQADSCKCLNARVRNDALPQAATVQELAAMGKSGEVLGEGLAKPTLDMAGTPTLFERTTGQKLSTTDDTEALLRERKMNDKATAERK
jgi:hypothetical protein